MKTLARLALLPAITLATLLLGCVTVRPAPVVVHQAPPRVYAYGGQPMVVESWYRDLHEHIEGCVGQKRSFDAITFLLVPPGALGERDGVPTVGLQSGDHIFIDARFPMTAWLIGHELAHYISGKSDVTTEEERRAFQAILEKCVPR